MSAFGDLKGQIEEYVASRLRSFATRFASQHAAHLSTAQVQQAVFVDLLESPPLPQIEALLQQHPQPTQITASQQQAVASASGATAARATPAAAAATAAGVSQGDGSKRDAATPSRPRAPSSAWCCCSALGCREPGCMLCACNPLRLCERNFSRKYLVGDALRAKCGASIKLVLLDGVMWKERGGDCRALGADDLRACMKLNNHKRGVAVLPELTVTDSSEALLQGRKPPFRLLVSAVAADDPAVPLPAVAYAVSEDFVVATRRVKQANKAEVPLLDDHVSKIEHIGRETVKKLADVVAAAKELNLTLQLPEGVGGAVTSVGQFQALAGAADKDAQLKKVLQMVLKLSKEKWEEAAAHAATAVVSDFRRRVWHPPNGSAVGLLFGCKYGGVLLKEPVSLLHAAPGGATQRIAPEDELDAAALTLMRQLKAQAVKSWSMPGHPGWSIFQDGQAPGMPANGLPPGTAAATHHHHRRSSGTGAGTLGGAAEPTLQGGLAISAEAAAEPNAIPKPLESLELLAFLSSGLPQGLSLGSDLANHLALLSPNAAMLAPGSLLEVMGLLGATTSPVGAGAAGASYPHLMHVRSASAGSGPHLAALSQLHSRLGAASALTEAGGGSAFACVVNGARMIQPADDVFPLDHNDSAIDSEAIQQVVSALAHMNQDSEADHYVAGFSANATIVANLDVTSQASVDAFIAAFIQLTATALNIDPANVYVTRVTKGGALLALKRVTPADDATVAGLRSAKLELVLGPGAKLQQARRSAQQQQPSSTADVIVDFTVVTLVEVALPPSPPPSPPLPPGVPPARVTSARVSRMPAQGTLSGDSSKPVVWYNDASFRSYRKPRSPLNLVFWSARRQCTATTTTTLPLYFREPMQLDSITITQLQNPGVLSVELLPWPATPIPELPDVAPVSGPKGQPVYSAASDSTPCGGDLVISVPSDRSGSSESVPPRGSQSELPPRLRRTAVGGIRITVKAQAKGAKPTFISSVRFSGRVLYPANPAAYDGM
eukprot:XP_001696119.1 predicted protein of CSE family [Chlamydomonas reinhardtii]